MPDIPAKAPDLYPIQTTFIAVREIHFVSHRPPSPNDKIEESSVTITQTATPFNEATRRVQVTLAAEFGPGNEASQNPPPFTVRVALTGEFVIDPTFPADKINIWITRNAPFVLYPYLRERLHYITSQGGYPPIMLPLMQIPTIRITLPQQTSVASPAASPATK
jgi:preprotein translocase subunit SecB